MTQLSDLTGQEHARLVRDLLAACPDHWPAIQELRTELDGGESDYYCLGVLGQALFRAHLNRDTASFPAIFSIVEESLVQNSPGVEAAVMFGLFEGLQNHGGSDAREFRQYLPPICLQKWVQVYGVWGEQA